MTEKIDKNPELVPPPWSEEEEWFGKGVVLGLQIDSSNSTFSPKGAINPKFKNLGLLTLIFIIGDILNFAPVGFLIGLLKKKVFDEQIYLFPSIGILKEYVKYYSPYSSNNQDFERLMEDIAKRSWTTSVYANNRILVPAELNKIIKTDTLNLYGSTRYVLIENGK